MSLLGVALLAAALLVAVFLWVRHEERLHQQASVPTGRVAAVWDGRERREHQRWAFSCPVRYHVHPDTAEEPALQAHIWDVSVGGVAARLPERLAPGAWVDLEMVPETGVAVKARGEVRWNRELPRVHPLKPREFLTGIQFQAASAQDVERLIALAQQQRSSA